MTGAEPFPGSTSAFTRRGSRDGEPRMVRACPHCNFSRITHRPGGYAPCLSGDHPRYSCDNCGEEFDDYVLRESQRTYENRMGVPRVLADLDPEDVDIRAMAAEHEAATQDTTTDGNSGEETTTDGNGPTAFGSFTKRDVPRRPDGGVADG